MNAVSNVLVDVDRALIEPSLQRRRIQCCVGLLLTDFLSVCAGFAATALMSGKFEPSLAKFSLALMPIYALLAGYNGAFTFVSLRNCWHGVWRAESALLTSVCTIIVVQYLIGDGLHLSSLTLSSAIFISAALVAVARVEMRKIIHLRCGATAMHELVIDDGGPTLKIPGAIHVSAAAISLRPDLNNPQSLDRLGNVLRNIDRVIVSCPPDRRSAWAMMLKGANVSGEVLDDEVLCLGAQGARISGGHGLLLVSAGPLNLRERAIKRGFDIAFSTVAIFLLSPLLAAVAMAIKIQDGGPVLFVQRRMGRSNRFFNLYKFRSMSQALCDKDGNVSASRDDQRITHLGKIIRRTSIDELPQLFNVLLGSMSLVGPRPHATGSLAGDKLFWEVDPRYWQRHSLKPGLSGLAQVRGYRGATGEESDLINRLQSDLEYLEGWTIRKDLKILMLTLRVIVHDRAF